MTIPPDVPRAPLTRFAAILALWMILPRAGHAASPSSAEMESTRRWAMAKLEGVAPVPGSGLHVLENHGPLQVNARGGEPIRIGDKAFARGLYCHASSRLIVRLARPARRFTCEIGVDGRAGGRSIVFAIASGGHENKWYAKGIGMVRSESTGGEVAVLLSVTRP